MSKEKVFTKESKKDHHDIHCRHIVMQCTSLKAMNVQVENEHGNSERKDEEV